MQMHSLTNHSRKYLNDQLSNTNSDFSPKIKKAVIVRGATFLTP